MLVSGINLMLWPTEDKALAELSSWGQGLASFWNNNSTSLFLLHTFECSTARKFYQA